MKMYIIIGGIFLSLFLGLEIYFRFLANYCEPWFDKNTAIIKRKRNTEGVYKTEYTNTGYFRINNRGWNSHRDYHSRSQVNGDEEVFRIAIVGHSNIEGLRVPYNNTISKVLEDELLRKNVEAEVYTFGFGRMHLAQALHVSRYVVSEYKPDILLIGTLLDNFLADEKESNFLTLKLEGENVLEVLPERLVNDNSSPISFLYFSRACKYLDVKFGIGNFLSANNKDKIHNSNVLVDSNKRENVRIGWDYILKEFGLIEKLMKNNTETGKVYFIDFPWNVPSYNYIFRSNYRNDSVYKMQILNSIGEHEFSTINMNTALQEREKSNLPMFDYPNDLHYNSFAHFTFGKYLAEYIIKNIIESSNPNYSPE